MVNYFLDTSVLISETQLSNIFPDSNIWISNWVLLELDKLKNGTNTTSFLARECIRNINELLVNNRMVLNNKCVYCIDNDRYIYFYNDQTDHSNIATSDMKIIRSYKSILDDINLKDNFTSDKLYLVSKDINMRNIALTMNFNAIDYITNVDTNLPSYNGTYYLLETEVINTLYKNKEIPMEYVGTIERSDKKQFELKNNDYMLVCAKNSTPFTQNSMSVLVKYKDGTLYNISQQDTTTEYIKPRNYKQKFAVDALLDDEIHIVFLIGGAGTGKTLLSLSTGLHQVLEEKKFDKIVIIRPNISVGEDIGYLPGSANEKITPFTLPIIDNLNYIFKHNNKDTSKLTLDFLKEYIEFVPLPFIRGRTFHDSYIIVDEAQNLTFLESKTILTRIGENSKIVFTGDTSQIDRSYLTSSDNGLSLLSNKLRNHNLPFTATIHLNQSERSGVLKKIMNLL